MNKDYFTFVIVFIDIVKLYPVESYDIPIYIIKNKFAHEHPTAAYSHLNFNLLNKALCLSNNKVIECILNNEQNPKHSRQQLSSDNNKAAVLNINRINSAASNVQPLLQPILVTKRSGTMSINPTLQTNNMIYPIQGPSYSNLNFGHGSYNILPIKNPFNLHKIHTQASSAVTSMFNSVNSLSHNVMLKPTSAVHNIIGTGPRHPYQNKPSYEKFTRSLDQFERKFYMVTFNKLTSISPQNRRVNGMSFVQSGFFLQLTLMALSLEVDSQTRAEIDRSIGFRESDKETISLIQELISALPENSDILKFRRASRMALMPDCEVTAQFRTGAAAALQMDIDTFNGTEKPEQMCAILNQKIETDSGGAIRDTFDEDDLSGGVIAILMTTLYFRARWRAAPTVLNGTWPFHDADDAPKRSVRMVKINDIMGYADIKEWNAQALEITYGLPDLSLLIIVPRVPSLRKLADHVTSNSISQITSKMKNTRVAATLPLYTLRMTLLLPNKLESMGISHLVDVSKWKKGDRLRLSHMVQRLMFWAEAGRNAYKDDGFKWDPTPEQQILIDRPYIFYVRWRNFTLMNGNFVL